MNIIKRILVNNDCYKKNQKIAKLEGFLLHSVGCSQPNAMVFINSWDKPGVEKCVHGFIEPEDVYQTLPPKHRGWHGGGSSNNTHEGYEMTEPATIKYKPNSSEWEDLNPDKTKLHVFGTYQNAVKWFAMRCREENLDPLKKGVILSHSEAHKLGIASNHADVEHIWKKYGLTMDGFRKDVSNLINLQTPNELELLREENARLKTQLSNLPALREENEKLRDKINKVKALVG